MPRPTARGEGAWPAWLIVLIATIGVARATVWIGHEVRADAQQERRAVQLTSGEPRRGRELAMRYGCGGCHMIPGVPGAIGVVGPPLGDIGRRAYIAGVLTNTPDNMIGWIEDPVGHDPMTAMPATGISHAEARDVAAYLYALR